jgi:spore coat protein U-like protein
MCRSLDKLRDIHFFRKGVFRMKKPVQCMLWGLVCALPCIAFGYQEQLNVKVSVKGGCTTTGNNEAHFGEHVSGTTHGPLSAQGHVTYWCSTGITHSIVADNGQNYSGGTRHMQRTGGSETIAYALAYSPDSATGEGPSPEAKVDVTVGMNANALSSAPPGEYQDTVTVTITP